VSYLSDPRIPARGVVQSHSPFDRLVAVGTGGAMFGASLGGPVGAVIGGLVGLAFAEIANRAEREQSRSGQGGPR
jgi:hypothetical protein